MPLTARRRCGRRWGTGWRGSWRCTWRRSATSWRRTPITRRGSPATGWSPSGGRAAAFLRRPWAPDAVTLRRADDGGKADGLVVGGLEGWVPLLVQVSELSGRGGGPRNERAD